MNSNVLETLCILLNMQNVSWHPRIHSDKPLYSSYLILKHLTSSYFTPNHRLCVNVITENFPPILRSY